MRRRLGPLLALAAALATAPLAAAAGSPEIGGFGVRPAHFDPEVPVSRAYFVPRIAPGGRAREKVVVDSTSETPLTLLVYPVDGLTGSTSGAVYGGRDDRLAGAGRWLSTDVSRVTVPPGGTVTVPFTVTVPRGAAPGDHLGGIAFQRTDSSASGGTFSVTQVLRAVVGVLVEVPGPAGFRPRLTSLRLRSIPGTGLAAISIGLGDAGGKLGKPVLAVSLHGPDGYHRTVERHLDTILPGDTIDYPFPWPDRLAPGWYTIAASTAGGAQPAALRTRVHLGATLRGEPVRAAAAPSPGSPTGGDDPLWTLSLALAGSGFVLLGGLHLWLRRDE